MTEMVIGLMVFGFAWIGAALAMKVEDVFALRVSAAAARILSAYSRDFFDV